MNDRIKLAEVMGWIHQPNDPDGTPIWTGPDTEHGDYGEYFEANELPDPENDANACNELIKHLNGLGFWVIINIHKNESARVMLGKGMAELHKFDWIGDNWMQGICKLALKVLENERLLRAAQEPCPLA